MMRKALHPEYYADRYAEELGPDQAKVMDHLDHCVDIIRQGIMCASDVRWVPTAKGFLHVLLMLSSQPACVAMEREAQSVLH